MGGVQIIDGRNLDKRAYQCEDQVDRPKGSSSEGILRARTLRKGFKLQAKKRQDIQLRLSVYREKSPN